MLELLWVCGLSAARLLARALPRRVRYRVAQSLAVRVSRFFPSHRRAVEENLAVIRAAGGRATSADEVFRHFGLTMADFLSDERPAVSVEGREKAEAALKAGKGVLFLTSHLGSWELGGKVLSDWKWDATAVYQPYKSRALHAFIQRRRAAGLAYIAVGKGAAAGVGRALARGGAVAILGDRPFGEAGVPVAFCGREARLPKGPFIFAARHGSPVVPAFILIESPGRYRGVIEEPIWPVGRGPAAAKDLLDRTARIVEKYVRLHPEQWYCFERVWSAHAPGV